MGKTDTYDVTGPSTQARTAAEARKPAKERTSAADAHPAHRSLRCEAQSEADVQSCAWRRRKRQPGSGITRGVYTSGPAARSPDRDARCLRQYHESARFRRPVVPSPPLFMSISWRYRDEVYSTCRVGY
ncbi:hypothetical protein MRX96_019026 [Rhipicephalus microplus]